MPHLVAAFLGVIIALAVGATTDEIIRGAYDSANTAFRVNVVAGQAGGSPAGSIGDLQTNADGTDFGAYAGDACDPGEAATAVSSAGALTCAVVAGSPGGSDTQVQYNDGGAFGGDAGMTYYEAADTIVTIYGVTVPNSGSTGTTANKLVKINSSGEAVIVGTSDTDDAIGICTANCGTTGSAIIATIGTVNCDFDSATTAGNYVGIDTSTAGDCVDLGASMPTTGVSVIGRVLSTNGSGGTYAINLNTPDVASAVIAGGGGGASKRLSVVSVSSSPHSMSASGDALLLVDTSGGSITVNLPNLGNNDIGKVFHIKKTSGSNTLTLDGDGADTIDGAATFDWTMANQSFSIAVASTSTWVLF